MQAQDQQQGGGQPPNDMPGGDASALHGGLQRQIRRIRLITALLLLLLAASASTFILHERRALLDQATGTARERAADLAADLRRTLDLVDVAAAQSEADWAAVAGGSMSVAIAREHQALRERFLAGLLPPVALHLLDEQGRDLDTSTHPSPPAEAPPAASGWQARPATRIAGEPVVRLVRRATANRQGVAQVAADLSQAVLLKRFEATRLGPGGSVGLFRVEPDGGTTVLLRLPYREADIGMSLRGPLAAALAQRPDGSFEATTQLDPMPRIGAYRRLPGDAASLVVAYAVDTQHVLAGWRAQLLWQGAVTLLLAGAMVFGAWRLERSLHSLAQQQRALEAGQSQLATLAANLPDVVVRLDAQGRLLYASPAIERATGLPPQAIIGKTNAEIGMPADSVAARMSSLQRVLASGVSERLEFAFEGPDGLRHWETLLVREPAVGGAAPTALAISRDVTERRQALQALQHSEERLREAQAMARVGHFELDAATQRMVWSEELARIHELPHDPQGFGFETLQALIHPDDRERVMSTFRDSIKRHEIFESTHRLALPSATERHVHVRGHHVYTDDGALLRTIGTVQDVTEQVRAERALRDSEERLRLALEAANQGLYDLDLTTGEAVVSPEYARMLGHEPASFRETNAAWIERLHPDDAASVSQAFQDYVAGRTPEYRVEFRQRTRSGAWKWILSLGRIQQRDAAGRPLRMLGTHTDIDAIKNAQAALAASEARYRQLFERNPLPVVVYGRETRRLLAVNEAFVRHYGYDAQEAVGLPLSDLYPPGEREAVAALAQTLSGLTYVGEWHHVTKDGRVIDIEARSHDLDYEGRPARMAVIVDITERKRAEQALRRSEQRFRLAASYGQVWEWDFGAGSTLPSVELFATLGHPTPPAEGLADAFEAMLDPQDYRLLRATLRRHLKREGPYHLQFRARDAHGRVRWFETQGQALFDEHGHATYMAGTTFEVTERREAEDEVRRLAAELEQRVRDRTAALARSEQRFRAIFDTVPVAIVEEDWSQVLALLRGLREAGVADLDAHVAAQPGFVMRCLNAVRVVRRNQQGEALHAMLSQGDDSQTMQSIFPGMEDSSQFADELAAVWRGQRRHTARRTLATASGGRLSLMLTMSLPALDDTEGLTLACLVDISEIDRLNAELDRTVARLRQANRELETFTYSVSHDLKAPLRGIDGYSRLLLEDYQDRLDAEGRTFLGHIRQATQHMGVLIDDLLAYSRLERRELTLAPLALDALVDGVLQPYRAEFESRGVVLEVAVPHGLRALADGHGLAMALRNLVDNALKFSRDSRPPRIRVDATRDAGVVRLAVHDNGLGFDMKFHDRIFAIFQRLHRAEDYPGTGVGLAIVRKAMERIGGRVWAQSQPGHGATFTLEMPEAA